MSVEKSTTMQIAEQATVGVRMAGADLQNASARDYNPHDPMV
jgi:hypothetical protein